MIENVAVNEPPDDKQLDLRSLPAYLRMIRLIAEDESRLRRSFDQAIGRLIEADPWYGLFFNRLRFRFGSFVKGWARTKQDRKWVKVKQHMSTACVCIEGREIWMVINPIFWAYMSLCGDKTENLPEAKEYDDVKIVGELQGEPVTEFERVFRTCLDTTSSVRMGCIKHELLHIVCKHLTRGVPKSDNHDECRRLIIGAELEVNQYIHDGWLWSFAQTIKLYNLPGKLGCEDYARLLPDPKPQKGGGGWPGERGDSGSDRGGEQGESSGSSRGNGDQDQDDEQETESPSGSSEDGNSQDQNNEQEAPSGSFKGDGGQDQQSQDSGQGASSGSSEGSGDQDQDGEQGPSSGSSEGDGDQGQPSKCGGAGNGHDRTGKDDPVNGKDRKEPGTITFDDHRAMTGQFDDVDDGEEFDQEPGFTPPRQGDASFDGYIEHKINGYVRTATDEYLSRYDKSRGLLPGEIEQVLKKMEEKEVVPWQVLLENYISDQYEILPMRSFRRCTRRNEDIFPGKKMDAMHRFVIGTDTSASVVEAELKLFVGQIDRIMRLFDDMPLIWLQCDARVHAVIEYDNPSKLTFEVFGRGGTSFQPIIDWCRENRVPNVILFTDGECPEPDYRGVKVLWVFTPCDEQTEAKLSEFKGRKVFLRWPKGVDESAA